MVNCMARVRSTQTPSPHANHRDGELHGEGQEHPDAVSPCEHGLPDAGPRTADGQDQRDAREDHADDPRVGHPPLGDAGEALAEISERIEEHGGSLLSELRELVDEGAHAEVAEE
jgi:hypothetical protein